MKNSVYLQKATHDTHVIGLGPNVTWTDDISYKGCTTESIQCVVQLIKQKKKDRKVVHTVPIQFINDCCILGTYPTETGLIISAEG